MKKTFFILLAFVLLLTLSSCKHKHDYKQNFVAPTCTSEGYTEYTCSCGHTYKDNILSPIPHVYGEWVLVEEPTEENEGKYERVCSCGAKETDSIPKLEHTHSYDSEVIAPTCTEQGYTVYTCRCGDSYEDDYVKATGHKYGSWNIVVEATTSSDGLKERVCFCGDKQSEVIPALGEDTVFTIEYILNREDAIWPSRNAESRNEIINELFKDLYEWEVGNGSSLDYDDYVADLKWRISEYQDINLRNPDLGNNPTEDLSTKYFLNIPKYYNKWADFFSVFNKAMLNVSASQSFYTDTYAAMVRLNQFIIWNSTGVSYFSKYISQMKEAVLIDVAPRTTYQLGDTFVLPSPSLPSGLEFLGWYDNVECTGFPVVEIYPEDEGNKVLYALWDTEIIPTSIEINEISEIKLFHTHQLVWSLSPDNITNPGVEFMSSDPSIANVTAKGLITTSRTGKVIITIKVLGNRNIDHKFVLNVYADDYINASYLDESYTLVGESVELFAEVIRKDKTTSNVLWTSLDETIATVDEFGVVTAHNAGIAKIVATDPNNSSLTLEFVITVLSEELEGILDLALRSHESNTFIRYDLNIGDTYYKDILGSVNKILGNSPLIKNTAFYDEANMSTATYGPMSSIEFVTVHYTGNMNSGADAKANADYFAGASNVSIHYTTGNDGVYYCLDESKGAYHAGDGASVDYVGKFQWIKTGVIYNETDPLYPVFTISDDFYYEINGVKTSIKMPNPYNYKDRYTDHILNSDGTISSRSGFSNSFSNRSPESFINDHSLPFKVVDGEYYMGTTWWCYTQVYEGRICSTGGNRNSIGIESCVNKGSDLWWTWQKTAQLVADIMYRHELDITRVRGHHFFTAKNCPQPMLENDLEIWYEFLELVEAEYELLSKYNGYSVSIESHNPEIVDNYGRVIKQPLVPTVVTYTITFTNGTDVQSITLASMVQGACVDK